MDDFTVDTRFVTMQLIFTGNKAELKRLTNDLKEKAQKKHRTYRNLAEASGIVLPAWELRGYIEAVVEPEFNKGKLLVSTAVAYRPKFTFWKEWLKANGYTHIRFDYFAFSDELGLLQTSVKNHVWRPEVHIEGTDRLNNKLLSLEKALYTATTTTECTMALEKYFDISPDANINYNDGYLEVLADAVNNDLRDADSTVFFHKYNYVNIPG